MIMALGLDVGVRRAGYQCRRHAVGVVLMYLRARSAGSVKSCQSSTSRRSVVEPRAEVVAPVRVAVARSGGRRDGPSRDSAARNYPYSAGIKGGIAGGAVMAALAVFYGRCITAAPGTRSTSWPLPRCRAWQRERCGACRLSSPAFIMALIIHGCVDSGGPAVRRDASDVPAQSGFLGGVSRHCCGPACFALRSR